MNIFNLKQMKIRILQLIITMIIIIGATNTISAQRCKYERDEIDGLLEVPVKLTKKELLCRINNQPIYVKAQCIGSNKYLKLRYFQYNDFTIQNNKEIAFVLPSSEEVILYPRPMPVDSTEMNEIKEVSTMLVYKLNPNQYDILANTQVIKFKYYISTGFVEEPIKESKQSVIMNLLRCVE